MEGIFWIWETYVRGLPSWTWHYPYHHPPSVSDFRDLTSISVEFELGKPLTHFQQLLALTPATDAWILPETYQVGTASPQSPYTPCEDYKLPLPTGVFRRVGAVVRINVCPTLACNPYLYFYD